MAALKSPEGDELFLRAWRDHRATFQSDLRLDDDWEVFEETYQEKESILALVEKTGNLTLSSLLL